MLSFYQFNNFVVCHLWPWFTRHISTYFQQHNAATLTNARLTVLAYLPVKTSSDLPYLGLNVRCFGCVNSFEGMMLHLQSVRLAIPARVVMGTWGISPFMLKMRSRGRVNAQAAKCHQSLSNRHISNVLRRQRGGKWMFNIKRVRSQRMQHLFKMAKYVHS